MQAVEFSVFGGAEVLHLTDVSEPVLRPTDLLVRVVAAGVNRADLLLRTGHYGRPDFGDSSLMGLEIAGDVIAVGSDARGFSVGDRVMGVVGGGGYAEVARIDFRMAMHVPAHLNYVEAAAIPEVFVTAHEALIHLAELKRGESVLIHAASGGVGSAAVQLARATGARVFATSQGDKLERVRELGADILIDYKMRDFAEEISAATEGRGVDVVIDFIGAPYLERNVRSLAEGGRLIQVGLMGGSKDANLPLDLLLYRHLRIIGTVMKSRPQEVKHAMTARFRDAWLEHFDAGHVKPVIDSIYPLARAVDAHQRMESNAGFGKIILTTLPSSKVFDAEVSAGVYQREP